MKKIVLILSFVFVLGLISLDAQTNDKSKEPVKTEKPVKKKVHKSNVNKATVSKTAKPVVKK